MTYALYHTDPPQFDKLLEYSDKMIDRAKRKEILEKWTSALRDFSDQSDFIDDLHNLIIEYENKRSVYPTYESFYPRILDYFQDQWNRLEVK